MAVLAGEGVDGQAQVTDRLVVSSTFAQEHAGLEVCLAHQLGLPEVLGALQGVRWTVLGAGVVAQEAAAVAEAEQEAYGAGFVTRGEGMIQRALVRPPPCLVMAAGFEPGLQAQGECDGIGRATALRCRLFHDSDEDRSFRVQLSAGSAGFRRVRGVQRLDVVGGEGDGPGAQPGHGPRALLLAVLVPGLFPGETP
ncbi:hypothetical protein ABZ438_19780 [Streptomyces sp. NPDC005786]|uniref:hypothetical protein n=1 Tax=Streptomyces sp. NPDC005786 TaxID=3154891 RepID=UPI0033E3EE4A